MQLGAMVVPGFFKALLRMFWFPWNHVIPTYKEICVRMGLRTLIIYKIRSDAKRCKVLNRVWFNGFKPFQGD